MDHWALKTPEIEVPRDEKGNSTFMLHYIPRTEPIK
jgi:hypothetical protein